MTDATCSAFPATKAQGMTGDLLWRGMLAGILAALLATLFARVVAEPQVDRAIAFEQAHEAHAHHHGDGNADADKEADEPIGRDTQKGAGLLTAMLLYGAAAGGLFALLFGYAYGRLARVGPRTLAAGLALLVFIAVALVPALKYPPNPPAVGRADTLQMRTAAYFAMLAASIVAAALAARVGTILRARIGGFDAGLAAAALFVVVIAVVQRLLPAVDEVPSGFPGQLLWTFRVAALGTQALLWTAIGLGFGWLADRRMRASPRPARAR